MNMQKIKTRHGSPQQQKGIATVLLVVLVGIALTATSLGIMHSLRSTQEKSVAVNAVTHAQTGVWAGAEALRRYLVTLDETALLGLPQTFAITLNDGAYGDIKAQAVSVTTAGAGVYRVAAEIINVHAAAQSSAALGVTIEITAGSSSTPSQLTAALNFYDYLIVQGGINFVAPTNGSTEVTIDGSFEAINSGLDSVSTVRATGSATVGGAVNLERIISNDDVIIKQGAWVAEVQTQGAVYVGCSPGTCGSNGPSEFPNGSGGAGVAAANGGVFIQTDQQVITADSRQNILVYKGAHGDLTARGNIELHSAASDVAAQGDVTVHSIITQTDSITSEGNLYCPTSDNMRLGDVSINGVLGAGCVLNTYNTTSNQVGATNSVQVIEEIDPLVIPPIMVDVWTLKEDANFAFEYDTANNTAKVTVKNINNVPDGTYFIAKYADNAWAYICETVNSSGICTAPSTRYFPVCTTSGEWASSSCINYNAGTNTWNVSGTSLAPGVMWFDGNLSMHLWYTYTTVLATGNVAGNGNMKNAAVNYGAYAEICEAKGDMPDGSDTWGYNVRYNNLYESFYPSNLCDVNTQTYQPMPIGNVAIASGGYDPDGAGAYAGGNVELAASSTLWGTVLAGGYLKTHGATNINGYVVAAALDDNVTSTNELDGATTIDLSVISEHFNPALIPISGSSPTSSGSSTPAAKLLWARYL